MFFARAHRTAHWTGETRVRTASAILAAALAVAWLGCGGEERADPRDAESEGTVIKLDSGDKSFEVGESVRIPEGFPSEVPLYPGAVPTMVAANTGEGSVVTLSTEDSAQKAFEFYKSKFQSEGWDIQAEMQMGGGRMITGSKGDVVLTVIVSASGESGAQITLTAGERG